jgi:hypothetical protein
MNMRKELKQTLNHHNRHSLLSIQSMEKQMNVEFHWESREMKKLLNRLSFWICDWGFPGDELILDMYSNAELKETLLEIESFS